jgi:hypothetical protein
VDFTQVSIVDQSLSLEVGLVIWRKSISELCKVRDLA